MQPNDRNPERLSQPESPAQSYPVGGSSARSIQPLSSEESIRNQAQAMRPEPSVQDNGQIQPASTAPSEPVRPVDTYGSNLVTEPINRPAQGTSPSLRPSPVESPPQKSGGKKIFPAIAGLIVVVGLAAGIYFFFLNGKLAAANLLEEKAQQTSYLRPEGWQSVSLGVGLATYSDLGEDGGAHSVVNINESGSIQLYGVEKDSDYYKQVRSQRVQEEEVDSIQLFFSNGGKNCTSDIDFRVDPDTKTTKGAIGLALAVGSCTREDGKYTVKKRVSIGEDDGIFRSVTVGASDSDWSKNEATFRAMLEGAGKVEG